tara:strand:+ start:204 stop:854 length:651 start_codon:yes stop_codon:yes gene_type:complete
MIINCENCSRRFVVKDKDIPKTGRLVQCGYCSVSWHQMPAYLNDKGKEKIKNDKNFKNTLEELSIDKIKASDGKTYKFLGGQWAVLLPSGKTGLFAKKKIGIELDIKTGRKNKNIASTRIKKNKTEFDPSSEILSNDKKLPDIYNPKKGIGFFGYLFLLIIISLSSVGVLKIFENYIISYMPELEFIYVILDEQSEFILESLNNFFTIVKDLVNSY